MICHVCVFLRAQNFYCSMQKLQKKAEVLQEGTLLTWHALLRGRFDWKGIKPPALSSPKMNQTQLFVTDVVFFFLLHSLYLSP